MQSNWQGSAKAVPIEYTLLFINFAVFKYVYFVQIGTYFLKKNMNTFNELKKGKQNITKLKGNKKRIEIKIILVQC